MTDNQLRYPRVNVPLYKFMKILIRLLSFVLLKKITVEGLENIPSQGAFVLVTNHLSFLDSPLLFAAIPRIIYFLAGERYQRHIFTPLMHVAGAIWVQRGEVDRNALRQAANVLEDGHCLAIAIEGTRSRTGALNRGKTGAAYIATRSNAPIVPVVLWGTEHIVPTWKRLRRPAAHLRIGEMVTLPQGHARSKELEAYTDDMMTTMASMLPEEYRGIYSDHPLLVQKLAIKEN
ncbi:MAG: 1-acyl-sn-glycerol-3-phosphate acyltransferase [Anaerolineae bacterium]|nr:1-acyl-sn-glycerol-3-phosphate acyltransferase [Anaerolineae bacterium]